MNNKEEFEYKAYAYIEGLLDTFERFGLPNPGKCWDCQDYGCSSAIGSYIDRNINRFEE